MGSLRCPGSFSFATPESLDSKLTRSVPCSRYRSIRISHARQPTASPGARLTEVEQRIRSLTALKAELELMVKGCSHGYVATCRVIEVLADQGRCKPTANVPLGRAAHGRKSNAIDAIDPNK